MYEPIGLEKFGDQIISTVGKANNDNKLTSLNKFPTLQLNLMWNISFYTSPLLVTFLYRRGYFVMESISTITKISTSIGLIVMVSMIMRGMGRSQSPSYARMIKAMELLKSPNTEEEGKRALRLFDFEFDYWKVDFDVKNIQRYSHLNFALFVCNR